MTRLKLEEKSADFITLPFYKNGVPLLENAPLWGMTLLSAGSMRFRWAEENPKRKKALAKIGRESSRVHPPKICEVQLDHTKTVVHADFSDDTDHMIADGIVTKEKCLMPTVTVADCLAIYFFDSVTESFAIVHSGWKGTGIAINAIKKMEENFGSQPKDISVAISAHIRSCCYTVEKERAVFFKNNFGDDCVHELPETSEAYKNHKKRWNNSGGKLYALSLEKANLNLLIQNRRSEENIVILDECTSCNTKFGSNRRETLLGKNFTVQAAFVRW